MAKLGFLKLYKGIKESICLFAAIFAIKVSLIKLLDSAAIEGISTVTTGSTHQLFHVPYSGNIEAINASRALELEVAETADVSRIFDTQIKRVSDAGIHSISASKPAVAGGLIVRCLAADVQKIYDAVYGTSDTAPTAKVISFPKADKTPSAFHLDFETSAAKFRLGIDFPVAAAAPKTGRAPDYTYERELAA